MLSNFDQNNLSSFRGDDLAITLAFTDTDNLPLDITGWTIYLTMKRHKDDTDAAAALAYSTATIPNPQLGVIKLEISKTVTATLTGSYFYDIQIKKADNTIQTITNGSFTFERDITRSEA